MELDTCVSDDHQSIQCNLDMAIKSGGYGNMAGAGRGQMWSASGATAQAAGTFFKCQGCVGYKPRPLKLRETKKQLRTIACGNIDSKSLQFLDTWHKQFPELL